MTSAQKTVSTRIEDRVILRHDLTNPQGRNVKNNVTFAVRKTAKSATVVEIVRRGAKNTRVRRDLKGNGSTFVVPNKELVGHTTFA